MANEDTITNGDDQSDNRVSPGCECPSCGEADADSLVWLDDEQVQCSSCQTIYRLI